ncbi:acyl-CoA dehydrogenase [Candidatus Bathyarchaeota archaeon]|nr:MAG: acyl-CoA dehydrogenase [Candidatus Bathyarchaeota archaeon]
MWLLDSSFYMRLGRLIGEKQPERRGAAFEVARESLQVHGGVDDTKDLPVERYFRDARFMMIGGGTSEIMRYIIQREVYKEMGRPS